jgi:hypothetical protein
MYAGAAAHRIPLGKAQRVRTRGEEVIKPAMHTASMAPLTEKKAHFCSPIRARFDRR